MPDLELGPELLTPTPVLCSLKTAPLTLRAGLMTLGLVVVGREKVTPGLGTYPGDLPSLLDPLRFQELRVKAGQMVQVSSCREGLSQPLSLEKKYPFQHRACSIIY